MSVPDRTTFENAYSGEAPWDVGRPQKVFIDAAERIRGSVLDVGCGTGENALFFAGRGHKVTGIDFLAEPIERANRKAAARGLAASFFVMDALALKQLPEVFDAVIDSGLFHVFNEVDRARYVAGLASVLRSGGRLFLLCFSDEEPGTQGPRRVPAKQIHDAFVNGWVVESIEPARFEVRPDLKGISFSAGGPKAWFAVVRRTAAMRYDFIAIPDADVPQAVEPVFQHVLQTYASEANKTASVWRAASDDVLDFKPHEKTNSVRTIMVHQLLSERRFFAEFVGTEEPAVEELLPPGEKPSVQAYIDKYIELVRRRLPQLARGATAWWLEKRPFFGGLERERIWIFWRRVLHTCHHRTQVQTWLRLAGQDVPAIYGPSGDVQWAEADPTYSLEAARRGPPSLA